MILAATNYISSEPVHEISNNVVFATSKASDQPAHMRRLIRAFASRLTILWLLDYWQDMIWSFQASMEVTHARLILHMTKYHIVGNHMSRLISSSFCLIFRLDTTKFWVLGISTIHFRLISDRFAQCMQWPCRDTTLPRTTYLLSRYHTVRTAITLCMQTTKVPRCVSLYIVWQIVEQSDVSVEMCSLDYTFKDSSFQ